MDMNTLLGSFRGKPFYLGDDGIEWVVKMLSGMSEDEKIAQLFCLNVADDDEEELKHLSADLKVGGVMVRPMALDRLVRAVACLRKNARVSLLVASNLESGADGACFEGTGAGSAMAVAAAGDAKFAAELAQAAAEEAVALGINWAFAPVIDIDYNFRNPITNTRTFGSNPRAVAAFGSAFVEGLQRGGVAACIKHFPGDGVDERDQHIVASVNTLSPDEWDKTYGTVYKTCIDAGAKTVMAAHIMLPSYSELLRPGIRDDEIMPALASEELLNDLLRGRLGFEGLIVSDSSLMAGLATVLPREKAVPAVIAAGCDMFLFTRNPEEDFAFMKKGVEDGVISRARLDEGVARILALKASLGLNKLNDIPNREFASKNVGKEAHKAIVCEIADRSITLVKSEPGVLPLTKEKYPRILIVRKEKVASGAEGGAGKFVGLLREAGFVCEEFVEGVCEDMGKYSLIIYLLDMPTRSGQTVVRLEWGRDVPVNMHAVPTIAVSLANPYHLLDMPRVKTYINTYGASDEILTSLLDKLTGKSGFKGGSPVDAFCGKWDTEL